MKLFERLKNKIFKRKNLIILVTDEDHNHWLSNFRNFDIIVLNNSKSKFEAIYDYYTDLNINKYDFIWCPDSNIQISTSDVNRLFNIAKEHDLNICQPSLTHDSYNPLYVISYTKEEYKLRYTNFIDISMPLFSINSFNQLILTFNKINNLHSWIWPKLLKFSKIAIIDEVSAFKTSDKYSYEIPINDEYDIRYKSTMEFSNIKKEKEKIYFKSKFSSRFLDLKKITIS